MQLHTQVVLDRPRRFWTISPRIRRGGPGKQRPAHDREGRTRLNGTGDNTMNMHGSHMPLDTMLHWQWNNPLNIIPVSVGISMILALIGLVV